VQVYLSRAQVNQVDSGPVWTLLYLVHKLSQLRVSSATVINLKIKKTNRLLNMHKHIVHQHREYLNMHLSDMILF